MIYQFLQFREVEGFFRHDTFQKLTFGFLLVVLYFLIENLILESFPLLDLVVEYDAVYELVFFLVVGSLNSL